MQGGVPICRCSRITALAGEVAEALEQLHGMVVKERHHGAVEEWDQVSAIS